MYKATYYKADGKKGRARALPDSLFDGVVNEADLRILMDNFTKPVEEDKVDDEPTRPTRGRRKMIPMGG